MVTLANFTDREWDLFCGCTDSSPLIAYVGDWAVIVDGSVVFCKNTATGEDWEIDLPNWRIAQIVAESLPNDLTGSVLAELGFYEV